MDAITCSCTTCAALAGECGAALLPLYRKKLLIRGWAGSTSPVEKAYQRAHRSEAASRHAASSAARLQKRPAYPPNPYRQRALRPRVA